MPARLEPGRPFPRDRGSPNLGVFTDHADIGPVRIPGDAVYDAASQELTLSGAGTNMWFTRDEFHFVWRRMTGDFIVRARGRFVGEGVDPHRKMGWIVRADLSPDAAYVDAAVHGDGLTSLQFRRRAGIDTEEVVSDATGPDVIQLERNGDSFTMSVARFGDPFTTTQIEGIALGDAVCVGLFLTSHNPDVLEHAVFSDIRIVVPAGADLIPYRDYLGSHLEILDIESGKATIVHSESGSFEAPNWTPDGRALIYNRRGKLVRFPLDTRTPEPIDTGTVDGLNNDHVLSFDGRWIGISHRSAAHRNQSIISVMPVTGGEPKRITDNAPSYLHGWSPDGTTLLYTAERDGNYDIYSIAVDGDGTETRLTTAPGLDDGSEYTPDGAFIYFNSVRTGTMQIWRMNPDGSDQTRITDDDTSNNWFPHVSPDGKWIVFLSFRLDVAPSDHPYYKPVTLRLMPTRGNTPPRIIAYVYGGQGTINVPSWSPDSKRLAFVSNSGLVRIEQ